MDEDHALWHALGEPPVRPAGEVEHAWNILVQVLLPLVLVLTFVIITSINTYRSAYKVLEGMVGKNEQLASWQLREAMVELQLLKLLKALDEVKREEEERLGISLFPSAARIQRQGRRLGDPQFRILCAEARRRLATSSAYADSLYQRILEAAEVVDPHPIEVRRWPARGASKPEMTQEVDRKGRLIVVENRRALHNYVLDFVDGVEERVVTLQVEVTGAMFDELLNTAAGLEVDSGSAALLAEIADPAVGEERRRLLVAELYRRTIRRWRETLAAGVYDFLPASWERLGL